MGVDDRVTVTPMMSRRRFLWTAALAACGLWHGGTPAWARTASRTHVVRHGETLSQLADRYGVSVDVLKGRNNLQSDVIRVGQRLVIPAPLMLADVIATTARLRIERGRWRYVVAHHSGIDIGNAANYDATHRRRGMENGLAYHFVIGNGRGSPDGAIEIGSRWLRQQDGGHVRNREFNQRGIGICLVGNFELQPPSAKQLDTLVALVDWLRDSAPLGAKPKFTVHRWVDRNHTVCPGKFFPYTRLRLRYA